MIVSPIVRFDCTAKFKKETQAAGCELLRAIAAKSDARGIPAARGGKWSAVQVSRLLERVNPSTVQRISRPFDGASVAVA